MFAGGAGTRGVCVEESKERLWDFRRRVCFERK